MLNSAALEAFAPERCLRGTMSSPLPIKPWLVAIGGSFRGTTFAFDADETSIGRDRENVVRLNHPSVSRRHCLIKRDGEQFTISDLDSYNGTFVNGVPVKEQALAHADQVEIGDIVLLFLTHEDEESCDTVALYDTKIISQSTMQLRREQALYLRPDEALQRAPQQARVARDLGVLLRISSRVNKVRHTEELQQEILDSIFEIVPAERGAILLSRNDEEFSSVQGHDRGATGKPVCVSRTVVKQVIKEAVFILSNDVKTSEKLAVAESLVAARTASLMCVPLIVFEKVIGAIYLDTSDATVRFDEGHLQLLAGIAGIAALALENARQTEWLEDENSRLRSSLEIEHNMIGQSVAMREAYRRIARVAVADSTVLIQGESGTGKELAAHAIHANSPRATKPFVPVNCAALTESLLESELFGHEKGAFTGAIAQKKGKLEIAQGGTVFLDEIGEMAAPLQARLLRFLQDHKIERVGGTRAIDLDVRVVAATNRNLDEAIANGIFRADLYHRLNVVTITMPSLRERREDIPLLASYFVAKYAKACKRSIGGISPDVRTLLQSYDWPGNVRELENAIEGAVVMGSTQSIEIEDLPERILEAANDPKLPSAKYYDAVKQAKRELILKALEQARGNYTEAAKQLGVHPNNLHRLIRSLDLKAAIGKS